jgi:hypothetical protein
MTYPTENQLEPPNSVVDPDLYLAGSEAFCQIRNNLSGTELSGEKNLNKLRMLDLKVFEVFVNFIPVQIQYGTFLIAFALKSLNLLQV